MPCLGFAPVRVKIVSNALCFGPAPAPGDIVEQRLTVRADGRVWFSAYAFDEGPGAYALADKWISKPGESSGRRIMEGVFETFSEEPDWYPTTDVGDWTLTVTGADGEKYENEDPLMNQSERLRRLTRLIREEVGVQDLLAFGGGSL